MKIVALLHLFACTSRPRLILTRHASVSSIPDPRFGDEPLIHYPDVDNPDFFDKPYIADFTVKNDKKPLILLDVDGVINYLDGEVRWKDSKTVPVRHFEISYSPTVIAKLNDWTKSGAAEIRWLTTWNANAQQHLAPKLGLRNFALAREVYDDTFVGKATAAYDNIKDHPDRPLIWIDDEVKDIVKVTEEMKLDLNFRTRNKTLFIKPYDLEGLTAGHLALIDRFIADPTSIPNNYENCHHIEDSLYNW